MPASPTGVEELLGRFVEEHLLRGTVNTPEELCGPRHDLIAPLRRAIDEYLAATDALDRGLLFESHALPSEASAVPTFPGFRTIERLGQGGMGEVYKLQDVALGRIVAAKVVRHDSHVPAGFGDFLREARTLALFKDRRIVQIHEFRATAEPPVIIMEFVDGFELGRLGPSLEFQQRARIMRDVADAVAHAHEVGIQHRDLKPSNIMLDTALVPRILDFGLSGGDPSTGHFRGTPAYLAPEQFDSGRAIDARTDVYALGVILYELLSGTLPYAGADDRSLLGAIETAQPRLPIELDPRVPEPLQAIALKAMEKMPDDRYPSARELALDLQRYLDGRPVLARPTAYAAALGSRLAPHLAHIEDWLRLKLIHPHEASNLRSAYRQLEARDDDWILESRSLSYSQITLYLGAAVLMLGSLLYFAADRVHDAVDGVLGPLIVLGLPLVGLTAAAHALQRRDHRAVAVAFYLGGTVILPLLLLIVFNETHFLIAAPGDDRQLVPDGWVSNRQLQLTTSMTLVWASVLAVRTRTVALSTLATATALLFALSVLADRGLGSWIEDDRWDWVAVHLLPLVVVYAAVALWNERARRPWFARPLSVAAAVLLFVCVELLALNGRELGYLGLSMARLQAAEVSDPLLLDTLTAMTLNGIAIYMVAVLADRHATPSMRQAAAVLFTLSPFATLQPIGWISKTGEYARGFDWLYLALAVTIAIVSHHRQRRAFYYAGLINTSVAIILIFDHYEWFDRPARSIVLILVGLTVLVAGFALDRRQRCRLS